MPADAAWYANNVAVLAAGISVVALGVSILSVRYARRQTGASERQARAAEETLRLQAEALAAQAHDTAEALAVAGRSAKAAEDSASSARTLVEVGQRAWVVLEPPQISETQSGDYGGSTVSVRANLRNLGATPALDVRAAFRLLPWAIPSGAVVTPTPEGPGISLGPNVPLLATPPSLSIRNAQLAEINQHRQVVLFWGECTYQDVFGRPHRTRWCLQCLLGQQSFAPYGDDLNTIT